METTISQIRSGGGHRNCRYLPPSHAAWMRNWSSFACCPGPTPCSSLTRWRKEDIVRSLWQMAMASLGVIFFLFEHGLIYYIYILTVPLKKCKFNRENGDQVGMLRWFCMPIILGRHSETSLEQWLFLLGSFFHLWGGVTAAKNWGISGKVLVFFLPRRPFGGGRGMIDLRIRTLKFTTPWFGLFLLRSNGKLGKGTAENHRKLWHKAMWNHTWKIGCNRSTSKAFRPFGPPEMELNLARVQMCGN